MSASWTKEQRRIARAERKALLLIALDGVDADPPSGRIELSMPADAETVKLVNELLAKLAARLKEKQ